MAGAMYSSYENSAVNVVTLGSGWWQSIQGEHTDDDYIQLFLMFGMFYMYESIMCNRAACQD